MRQFTGLIKQKKQKKKTRNYSHGRLVVAKGKIKLDTQERSRKKSAAIHDRDDWTPTMTKSLCHPARF